MAQTIVQTEVDRYIIIEYIAEGGMGAIFRGKKVGMGGFEKEVVLKQLLPEYTSQPEFIDLFLREAKLSASLDHPNIVRTIDLVTAGKDYFIVMEYVQGGDLRTIQRRIKQRRRTLSPAAAVYIGREILNALAYAHEKRNSNGQPLKLIHRDVSPSNIMVSASGEVKLADFGIAKASTHHSVFYRVKGKVGYMSPEQAFGTPPLDHRSDLFSLAICLHEMLSGSRLFVADLLTLPQQIYNQPIPSLEHLPGVPRGLDRVLAKALALDPNDRFQTALEFQSALMTITYDNQLLCTALDLANHLKDICGEDQSTWNTDEEEASAENNAGNCTPVLAEEHSQFSGVSLTSIFASQELAGNYPASTHAPVSSEVGLQSQQNAFRRETMTSSSMAFEHTMPVMHASFSMPPPENRSIPAGFDSTNMKESAQTTIARPLSIENNAPSGTMAVADETRVFNKSHSVEVNEALTSSVGKRLTNATREAHLKIMPPLPHDEAMVSIRRSRHKVATVSHPSYSQPVLAMERPALSQPEGAASLWGGAKMAASNPADLHLEAPDYIPVIENSPSSLPQQQSVSPIQPLAQPTQSIANSNATSDKEEKESSRQVIVLVALILLLLTGIIIAVLVGVSGPSLDENTSTKEVFYSKAVEGSEISDKEWGLLSAHLKRQKQLSMDSSMKHNAIQNPGNLQEKKNFDNSSPLFQAQNGIIKINSTPTNANVYLDGIHRCQTPCVLDQLNPNHIYQLSIQQKGYMRWSSLIDLRTKSQMILSIYLAREPSSDKVGYLLIRSDPSAEILVDGKSIGRITSEGSIPLFPGQYEITLVPPRQSKHPHFKVTIHQGQTVFLWPKF